MPAGRGLATNLALDIEDLAEKEIVVCFRHVCRCSRKLLLKLLKTRDKA
jgi:hypothetical protein